MDIRKSARIIKIALTAGAFVSIISAATAFAAIPTVTSAKITGPNTVAIVFSEAVNTHDYDYTYFTGTLEGRNITSLDGNNTNTITLTFSGNPMPAGTTASLGITATTIAVSDQSPFVGGTVNLADGQTTTTTTSSSSTSITPDTTGSAYYLMTSLASRSRLRVADTLTFTLRPSPQFPKIGATVTGSYNGVPLTWSSTEGGGAYTATYTVAKGDPETTTPLQLSGVILTDANGKRSVPLSSIDVSSLIDTTEAMISEVTKIASPADSTNLQYTFHSNRAGSINFGGGCVSANTTANIGDNTIKFNQLPNGAYSDCIMNVSSYSGGVSNVLKISPFAIGSPLLAQIYTPAATTTPPAPTPAPTPAPAPASFKFTLTLKVGSKGNEVTELQKRLIADGFLTGSPTGYFGNLTKAAVKLFQAKHGVAQLGNIGPATRAALNQ